MAERDDAPRGNRGRVPDLDNFERLERLVRELVERHLALRRRALLVAAHARGARGAAALRWTRACAS